MLTSETHHAHKIGIGNFADRSYDDRITRHTKKGWTLYRKTNFETADIALTVEQEVLAWLRHDRGLPPYLSRTEMPHGGWTETVDADAIGLPHLWRQILATKRRHEELFDPTKGEA